MKEKSLLTKILLYEAVGFLAIIVVSWFAEITDLRALVLGDHPYISDFKESALEMLIVLAVWLVVAGCTRRLLQRISYLEKFMRVCAWCRHIYFQGKWIPLEEFLQQGLDASTTHGICPDCFQKESEAIERSFKAQPDATRPPATIESPS